MKIALQNYKYVCGPLVTYNLFLNACAKAFRRDRIEENCFIGKEILR